MPTIPPNQITQLLIKWSEGDQAALDELIPLVYDELHRLAKRYMRNERTGHTLQTTAVVNEAYLRLVDYHNVRWQERAQFFAIAARVMRRLLVDHARTRGRGKRGGAIIKVSLHEEEAGALEKTFNHPSTRIVEVIALDEALTKLEGIDTRKCRVVELRSFVGLSNDEIAEVLKISPNTVTRDWNFARAWLTRELGGKDPSGS